MGVWLISTYAWLIASVGVWLTWLSLGSTPRAMDQRCLLRDTGQPDLQSCLASGARPSLTTGGGGGVGWGGGHHLNHLHHLLYTNL